MTPKVKKGASRTGTTDNRRGRRPDHGTPASSADFCSQKRQGTRVRARLPRLRCGENAEIVARGRAPFEPFPLREQARGFQRQTLARGRGERGMGGDIEGDQERWECDSRAARMCANDGVFDGPPSHCVRCERGSTNTSPNYAHCDRTLPSPHPRAHQRMEEVPAAPPRFGALDALAAAWIFLTVRQFVLSSLRPTFFPVPVAP